MITINCVIELESYIAHPYWPEMNQVVNIQKESGMNRARSAANQRAALEQHLNHLNMTLKEYDTLVARSQRPFHTDDTEHIYIPKASVDGMLVQMCDSIRAANRPCPPHQVRSYLNTSSWNLNCKVSDAKTWERYVVVTSGTGAKLSNQRGLRRNQYIGNQPPGELEPTFTIYGNGSFHLDPQMVKPEILQNALQWAGKNVGIGASRKMGWGRFQVVEWNSLT